MTWYENFNNPFNERVNNIMRDHPEVLEEITNKLNEVLLEYEET